MTTAAPPVGAAGSHGGFGRTILIVLGSIAALIGIALAVGAGVIVWADATQRDDDGFFTTPTERFVSPGYAITHERAEVLADEDVPGWLEDELGTVKVTATGADRPVFVGIGPADDVESYLDGVSRSLVDDVDYHPFRADYDQEPGGAPAVAPGDNDFWVASSSGAGPQTVTWDVEQGDWSLVVMNADASRGVLADVEVGGKVDWLGWVALGLAGTAILFIGGAALLLTLGIRGRPAESGAAAVPIAPAISADAEAVPYPVAVEADLDPGLSRWRWLVKWFLAIPHWFVLAFLWAAFLVLTIVAFFAILFTGRYPRSIFEFNVGVMRWTWRVAYFATNGIGTDRYPPFSLGEEPDYPARLAVPYPERLSRRLVLVKSWLLAIPHIVIVSLLVWGVGWATNGAEGGVISVNTVLFLAAGACLLFAGRYPLEIWRLAVGINRWAIRVGAYIALMRDEYPPFRLEP
jgi:hypothetical protein